MELHDITIIGVVITMGSPPYPGGYNDATQHQVTITGPYWLQATAVTQIGRAHV